MANTSPLFRLEVAYYHLLMLPHGKHRAKLQSALASLRDQIADETQTDPEEVQNKWEAITQ